MIHLLSYYYPTQIPWPWGKWYFLYTCMGQWNPLFCRDFHIAFFFQDDVAYFSFPFHFEVFYKNDNLDEDEKGLYVDQLAFNTE